MNIPFVDLKSQYEALKGEINQRIQAVLEHGQYIMGPEVEELEQKLAKFTDSKYAFTCSNGTDAAVIAMMAMGIGHGDEVITTGFSFIATAETIVLVGAKPIYVDIDSNTYNIDVSKIEAAITPKTKAIQPVSLYGQVANMDEINRIAKKHNIYVIEDAAQSFGGTYKGQKSCNLCDVGVTSFFPAKPLGCYGDGGAIFTNNDELAAKIKLIRVHGQKERYYHTVIGMNGRMDTLQCAIMIPKLEKFPWELVKRQEVADYYTEKLAKLTSKGLRLPVVEKDRTSAWAQYTIWVPDRKAFQEKMKTKNIPTSIHYPLSMPDQPAYLDKNCQIPNSRDAADHVLSLPMHPYMDRATQDLIIKAVEESLV